MLTFVQVASFFSPGIQVHPVCLLWIPTLPDLARWAGEGAQKSGECECPCLWCCYLPPVLGFGLCESVLGSYWVKMARGRLPVVLGVCVHGQLPPGGGAEKVFQDERVAVITSYNKPQCLACLT